MHRLPILILVLCGVLTAAAEDSARKIAYERDGKIFVANLDGTAAKKVGDSSILFLSQGATEKTASLYRMTLPGGAVSKPLAKDVSQPTVSK